jgi:LuxR family maltose regulon positive regulatory protein
VKKQKTLRRDRVNRTLESIFEYPLTVMEAPIGYGKTTAVREFLASKGCSVLWLSFLSSEDTSSFFWNRLSEEICRLDEEAGMKLKLLGFPADAPQTATVLSVLSEIDFKENTVLVIDDFHLVKSPQIGKFLYQLVRNQPDSLYITIVTRDTSNLDLLELAAKGLCNIVPQQVLRFTDNEVRDYCVIRGCRLNDAELKQICAYTGGWISMVYLTLLGIDQGIPIGKNDAIADLVEKALYNTYDDDIRRFLLKLSVMDSFTAEQAEFVTEEPRTKEFLKKLRLENAFIAYNNAAGVYSIHSVLLDFLKTMLKDKQKRKALWRRMGQWYLSKGAHIPACSYLCRGGDTGRILSLLNDINKIAYNAPSFEGFLDMFAAIPRETLFNYPYAYMQYIDILMINGDSVGAQEGLARLNEFQDVYEHGSDISPDLKNRILGEISTMRIFAVFNDAGRMVAQMNEALRLLDGDVSYLMKRESEFTFGSPHFLYTYYREPGRLKETADYMVHEFPLFAKLASGCGTGCDYLTMAEYALETGGWQSAELYALKAIYKAKTKEQTGIIICANFALIRLNIYLGKTGDALEHMRKLRDDVTQENSVYYNTALELVEGYINACMRRPDGIPGWLSTGDMSAAHFMFEGIAFNYIVHGKAVLLSKDYVRLEILTEELEEYFSVFHNQLGFLHNKIFEAAAKYRLYGMEKGCAALVEAIDMAREDHLILPFAEYAPDILDMLRNISHSDSRDIYIKEVLKACEQYSKNIKSTPQSALSLSPRETQILALASEGLKRDEIALRLHVSTATVRTHLQNIYQKLEVGSRTAAVKKAETLKIL